VLSTAEIMNLALDLVGFTSVPADSAIEVEGAGIRRALFGIDVGPAEMLLAARLGLDAVIAHHPSPAVQTYPAILDKHVDQMTSAGVPQDVARAAVTSIKEAAALSYHRGNYGQNASTARLLGLSYLNIHNPLDELGRRVMDRAVREALSQAGHAAQVKDVVGGLMSLPEFRTAPTRPLVALGDPLSPAGKVVVSHGAGTNGRAPVALAYYNHGIDTVVYIHLDYSDLSRLRAEAPRGANLVVAGHIVSDLVGINPFVRSLEERGLEIVRAGGL
jgi:putative NIF3 family GTP cyclohydrolase 1 type 2